MWTLFYPGAINMGKYYDKYTAGGFYIDQSWRPNDGMVNTVSAFYPIHSDGTRPTRGGGGGEPQGTAGQPMLNVFQRENVENVVCIVTRYFGGILLGAGGLTRAYAKAAKDALDKAGKARMQPFSVLLLECPYPMFERIKLLIEGHEGRIESSDYGAAVTLTFLLPVQKTADFSTALTELSGGQMSAEEVEQRFLPGARE